jgi:hypothetical protein
MARRKSTAVALAVILSLVLFGAGLLSGLYVSRVLETRQQQDFSFLVDYVNKLDADLKSFQLQEKFLSSLSSNEACIFATAYFDQITEDLKYYWQILPGRLEAYERDRELSEEYLELKKQYTALSIRAWIISRENYEGCDSNTMPILYFYGTDCENCVEQGEELDDLKSMMQQKNITVISFTVDKNTEDPALSLIEKYYGVNKAPALVIKERTYQGRVYVASELAELI